MNVIAVSTPVSRTGAGASSTTTARPSKSPTRHCRLSLQRSPRGMNAFGVTLIAMLPSGAQAGAARGSFYAAEDPGRPGSRRRGGRCRGRRGARSAGDILPTNETPVLVQRLEQLLRDLLLLIGRFTRLVGRFSRFPALSTHGDLLHHAVQIHPAPRPDRPTELGHLS